MRLSPYDLAAYVALGITPEMLDRMQVHRVDDREAREVLGLNGRPGELGGILYPYFDPMQQRILTYRLRRDRPDFETGKPKNKYLSAYGDRRHLYLVVSEAEAMRDTSVPIVAVEAEKSVLSVMCAASHEGRALLAVGLGGCYGWRGRIGKTETMNGGRTDEYGPLPDFDRLAWTDRDVVLAFDSNAATSPAVQTARRALGVELARRGARIRVLDLQPEHGVNGPDDYIGRYGAKKFFDLFDAAPDALTFDVIFRLNRKHAVVREVGRTVVITEEHDPVLNRRYMTRSSFADFRNFYLGELVPAGVNDKTGKPRYQPLGHVWLKHRDRRQYEGMVMSPAGRLPGYLNLWQGFVVEPTVGDWSRFKTHIFEVVCASNVRLFDYVLAWMAAGVQHPERQAEVALALRGPRGAGKGVFARGYGDLFGQHYLQIANAKHLTGHFNAHLQDAIVLFADEAFWAGDKSGESVLKMLITEPVIPIERKGRDLVIVKNLLHIIIASNQEWVVPAGMDERRFCVLDIDPGRRQDHAYFSDLAQEMQHGGRAAMLFDLLRHDASAVNLRAVPATEALRMQKVLSLQPSERWLFDKLMMGRWLTEHDGWEALVPKDALHDDYVQSLKKIGIDRRSTQTELGMFITRILGSRARTTKKTVAGRARSAWAFANLDSCRLEFDHATNSHHPWPRPDDEEQETQGSTP